MTQSQTYGRFVLSTIVAISMIAITSGSSSASTDALTIVEGFVEVGRGTPPTWEPARVGAALGPGDSIRTDTTARAEARIRGTTIRLYGDSMLRLPEAASVVEPATRRGVGSTFRLQMDRGRALFDVIRGSKERSVEVRTPEVVVSVRGTRFSVDSISHVVAVFRGEVGVRGLTDEALQEILVREGFSTTLLDSGALELVSSPVNDPWSTWSQGAGFPAALQEGAFRPASERALKSAMKSARQYAAPRALEHAIKENPDLREKLADAIAQQASDGATSAAAEGDERDSVLDRPDVTLDDPLLQNFVGEIVDPTNPGGGGGTGSTSNFVFTYESSGGPNRVIINETTTGFSDTLFESEIEDIADGQAVLSSNFTTLLNTLNISETDFILALQVFVEAN